MPGSLRSGLESKSEASDRSTVDIVWQPVQASPLHVLRIDTHRNILLSMYWSQNIGSIATIDTIKHTTHAVNICTSYKNIHGAADSALVRGNLYDRWCLMYSGLLHLLRTIWFNAAISIRARSNRNKMDIGVAIICYEIHQITIIVISLIIQFIEDYSCFQFW